jgi:hypothetical protein
MKHAWVSRRVSQYRYFSDLIVSYFLFGFPEVHSLFVAAADRVE